jgi:hypothetical protein
MSNTTQGGGQFIGNLQGGTPPSANIKAANFFPINNTIEPWSIDGVTVYAALLPGLSNANIPFVIPRDFASIIPNSYSLRVLTGIDDDLNLEYRASLIQETNVLPGDAQNNTIIQLDTYFTDTVKDINVTALFNPFLVATGMTGGLKIVNPNGISFYIFHFSFRYNST